MSALEPGLYRATVRGVADQIIKVVDPESYGATCTVHTPDGKCVCHEFGKVTDARPLIVLDLDSDEARHLVSHLQNTVENHPENLGSVGRAVFTAAANQIIDQTKPARIPEPGLWGVVEADGYRWVRFHNGDYHWGNSGGNASAWDDLIDPTLIREGVTS